MLLEWDAQIFEHITFDDHIELICAIYLAGGYSHPSRAARALIEKDFKPITTGLKVFQEHLLSSAEVFHRVLEKVGSRDDFSISIVYYTNLEFMVALLNKVVDKEIMLRRIDLNTLSRELNCAGRKGLEELTDKIYKNFNT